MDLQISNIYEIEDSIQDIVANDNSLIKELKVKNKN